MPPAPLLQRPRFVQPERAASRAQTDLVGSDMSIRIDAIDRAILETLQKQGRISNAELAESVGLSPPPCMRRVRKLEELGVIERYIALVDPAKVGMQIKIFCAGLADQLGRGNAADFR